jgi:predicted nucleic acid-binding protein
MLRRNGRLYKVFTARHMKDNWWTFECLEIESRVNRVFKYQMLGIIEALESAASTKDPKDVLMIDLDNQGKCKIMTKEQIDQFWHRKHGCA